MAFWSTSNPIANTLRSAQQQLGGAISVIGSSLPGNQRIGSGGGSLGAQIASGQYSNPNIVFPSLVKPAYAAGNTNQQSMYGRSVNPTPYVPERTQQTNTNRSTGGTTGSTDNSGQFDFTSGIISPDSPFGGGGSEIDAINNEFNQFNSYLDTQEQSANQNFSDTKGLYDTQKANAETQYANEKTSQTEGIKKTEALNLKKVRQLLSELSQGNAARTAISGGGSISEVLGERFGREAQSRLGGVMDATQQAITRVNDFYNNAITKLNESYQANILSAKQALDENLGNIRLARTQSAAAKQQASLGAWRDYYNQVNQAKVQAQTFKAQYDMWKQQQDNAYAATAGFNEANAGTYNNSIADATGSTPQAPGTIQTQDQYNVTSPTYRVQRRSTNPDDPEYYQEDFLYPQQSTG